MKLESLGEFGLIGQIRDMFQAPDGVMGIGDDCAVIPQEKGMETLVSTDMLIEGSHFLLDDISAVQLGWKAAAVNISDIAAMGGTPTGSFLSIALPKNLPDGWVEEFLAGYAECSEGYETPLLGGDTTSSPDRLCISVTVMGVCRSGHSLKRNGAKVGDLVCVTGTLGDSAGGLHIVLNKLERFAPSRAFLLEKHYVPQPRVAEGQILAECPGVHSAMDISDGIASDLRHIMEESGVGASIDVESIPVSPQLVELCAERGLDVLELATSGGEDYELLFTMDPDARPAIPYTVIGHITEGDGIEWVGSDRDYLGFRHF